MYFCHPRSLLRTASFGLALLYAGLFTAFVLILGFIVYWTVQSSMDKQLTARIDTEIDLLRSDFRSEGSDELVEQVQRRVNFIDTLEYALTDASGKTLAGNLEPTKLGWSDISFPRDGKNPGFYRVESVLLDNGYRLAVADDLGPKDEIRRAFLDALGWALLAFLILSLVGGIIVISLADCGSHFVASVTDDGPGVPEMERERIFRRFYRLEQSSSKPGHGLGLTLVAAVAELRGRDLPAADNGAGPRLTTSV